MICSTVMAVSFVDQEIGSNDWHATFVASVWALEPIIVAQDACRIPSAINPNKVAGVLGAGNRSVSILKAFQRSSGGPRIDPSLLLSIVNEKPSERKNRRNYPDKRRGGHCTVTFDGKLAASGASDFGRMTIVPGVATAATFAPRVFR